MPEGDESATLRTPILLPRCTKNLKVVNVPPCVARPLARGRDAVPVAVVNQEYKKDRPEGSCLTSCRKQEPFVALHVAQNAANVASSVIDRPWDLKWEVIFCSNS